MFDFAGLWLASLANWWPQTPTEESRVSLWPQSGQRDWPISFWAGPSSCLPSHLALGHQAQEQLSSLSKVSRTHMGLSGPSLFFPPLAGSCRQGSHLFSAIPRQEAVLPPSFHVSGIPGSMCPTLARKPAPSSGFQNGPTVPPALPQTHPPSCRLP